MATYEIGERLKLEDEIFDTKKKLQGLVLKLDPERLTALKEQLASIEERFRALPREEWPETGLELAMARGFSPMAKKEEEEGFAALKNAALCIALGVNRLDRKKLGALLFLLDMNAYRENAFTLMNVKWIVADGPVPFSIKGDRDLIQEIIDDGTLVEDGGILYAPNGIAPDTREFSDHDIDYLRHLCACHFSDTGKEAVKGLGHEPAWSLAWESGKGKGERIRFAVIEGTLLKDEIACRESIRKDVERSFAAFSNVMEIGKK